MLFDIIKFKSNSLNLLLLNSSGNRGRLFDRKRLKESVINN
jgi:hypothetical protein